MIKIKSIIQQLNIKYIVLLAIVMRLLWYFFILLTNPQGFWMHDSDGYWNIAFNVKEYGIFSRDADVPLLPDYFRTPLYPLLIIPTTWFDASGNTIPLIHIFIDTITCLLLYKLVLKITGSELYGKSTALIYAFHIQAIVFSNFVLTESIFAFILCLFTWILLNLIEKKSISYAFFLGITGGLAVMCKPIAFVLIFPTIVFIFIVLRFNRTSVIYATIFASCFYAIQVPWMQRNKNEFGRYFNSVLGEHLLYGYHTAHIYAKGTGISYENAKDELIFKFMGKFDGDPYKKPYEYAKLIEGESYKILWKYKWIFLKEHLKECFKFFAWPMKDYIVKQMGTNKNYSRPITYILIFFQSISTIALLLLFGIFKIQFFRKKIKSHWIIWFIATLWLIFVQFNTMPYTDGRMRFPFDWSFILVAFLSLYYLRHNKRSADFQ